MNPIITKAAQNPILKAACTQVANQISQQGLITFLDGLLDKAAYRIAKHIIDQEQNQEKKHV